MFVIQWLCHSRVCRPRFCRTQICHPRGCHSRVCYFRVVVLKGQSNDLQLFSSFKPAWATDQWVKIYLLVIPILVSKKLTPCCMILYCGDLKKYGPRTFLRKYKMQSLFSRIRKHIFFGDTVPLKVCVKVLRNGWGHE